MVIRFILGAYFLIKYYRKWLILGVLAIIGLMFVTLAIGKIFQHWDKDPDRGAIAINNGAFGESYSTPVYLKQGWSESQSLWFYNTTQGSALLPYDFFIALEQAGSTELFRSDANMDFYRYLPQKATFFNPDALPVGFTKDTYKGNDYMGFTCAACHTGQVNYQGQAIRIDGGPAMADMVGFLHGLEKSMKATLEDDTKRSRFIEAVLKLRNDYRAAEKIIEDLEYWTSNIELYNTINHTSSDYGYARLDAFGRIYNRVLQHVLNRSQLQDILLSVTGPTGQAILTKAQAKNVLEGIDETIIGDREFLMVHDRLLSKEAGFPGLSQRNMLRIRDAIFNPPNAPVSYPFLWDISHTDYIQWNGLANNAGMGPIGRNTGEVIGVFAILDWHAKKPGFSFSAWLSGQDKKQQRVAFNSSINLVNLERLEAHLRLLKSPVWPEEILGEIDREKAARGRVIYAQYCQSCHEMIERDAWDRLVVSKMSALDEVGTDPLMAQNSVNYKGRSGNFRNIYQKTEVGPLVLEETAPVVQILTAVTKGVVGTPDYDKNLIRRRLDWLYALGLSFFDNDVLYSVKAGNYRPDTTAEPYASLLSYKARPLNGIWATAPYLHNGSVPSLYELLLPKKREGDPEDGQYRPDTFSVGSREFDPVKVGFRSEGYDGFDFRTFRAGDLNIGHEYASGHTRQLNGEILPALNEQQRWDLVEYLKTL